MENTKQDKSFERIASAIRIAKNHTIVSPALDAITLDGSLVSSTIQRQFVEWGGISLNDFLNSTKPSSAKKLLQQPSFRQEKNSAHINQKPHNHYVKIVKMTPAEYLDQGRALQISYYFYYTPFGECLVASTQKGICNMIFVDDQQQAMTEMKSRFPSATYVEKKEDIHHDSLTAFSSTQEKPQLCLHLKGTPFQLKVWEALLRIPLGNLTTYGVVAKEIQHPKASRAVGTAIGSNPIAFIIPCHRVIQSTGLFGGYMWGTIRKTAIIGWEQAQKKTIIYDAI